jgi:hypothetical protein
MSSRGSRRADRRRERRFSPPAFPGRADRARGSATVASEAELGPRARAATAADAALTTDGQPAGSQNRRALVIAGDDPVRRPVATVQLRWVYTL